MRAKKRILIVDDHPLLRMGLRVSLENEFKTFEAADVPTAQQTILKRSVDLAIVDLHLTSGSGLDVIRFIRSSSPDTRCLVLTQYPESLYISLARLAGANGFLDKRDVDTCLAEAIDAVMRGDFYPSSFRSRHTLQDLSARERQVFELMGVDATIDEIARLIGCAPKTVETHRDRIRIRFHLKSSQELSRMAVHWQQFRAETDVDSNR